MTPGTQQRRPNVLFLMTDEHRFDIAGFAGDPVVRTPNLDRIAAAGSVFSNAYTPSPSCIPARQSLMAGQLPVTTGCLEYGDDLAPGHGTWAGHFSRYGYRTVVCGKLHHLGPDQLQGWTTRVAGDVMLGGAHAPDRSPDYRAPVANRRSQGWSQGKEVRRAGVGRGPYQAKDDLTVQGACDFIESHFSSPAYDRATPEIPLMLKVSLHQPHYPYLADAERFSYYLNRVPIHVETGETDHPDIVPPHLRVRPGADADAREIRRATAAYYAMVEKTDELFGRVITALEHHGQDLDDWIIVYTSDHGEMLGERGLWAKSNFFEPSVRVPLVITAPGLGSQQPIAQNVSLCDLYATLCDLAGLPIPQGLDSRSAVPLLRGESDWDDEVVSQYGLEQIMIKQGPLKYQAYGGDVPEILTDVANDPSERTNLADDPSRAEVMQSFRLRHREILDSRPPSGQS